MAPKTQYNADLLQSRADELVRKEIDALGQAGLVLSDNAEIICEYLGVAGEEGFDAGSKIRGRAVLGFQWRYSDGAVEVCSTESIRCDHFMERGIRFPDQWKIALKCQRLSGVVNDSVSEFAEQHGCRDVTCRVLGAPREVHVYTDGRVCRGYVRKCMESQNVWA